MLPHCQINSQTINQVICCLVIRQKYFKNENCSNSEDTEVKMRRLRPWKIGRPSDDEDCVTWKFILMVYMQSWDNSSRNDIFSRKLLKSENKRRICWYYIKVFILPKNQAFRRWQKASSVLLTVEEQWFGLVPCKNKDFKNKIVEIYVSYCLIH